MVAALAAAAFALIFNVQAQSVWSGAAGNWSSNVNPGWNGTGVPNATDAVADSSAATGNITVDGSFTLGTLAHKVSNSGWGFLDGGATTKLVFDVSSGKALVDGPVILKGSAVTWSANAQLNDDLEIRTSITNLTLSYENVSFSMNGVISGAGGITLSNTVGAAVPLGASMQLVLSNTNSFTGGITVYPATAVTLKGTNAAGSGTIDFSTISPDSYSTFSFLTFNTRSQTHDNALVIKKPGGGQQACWFITSPGLTTPITVTLNGSITSVTAAYAARVRFGNGPGTLVLGGDNSGWNGEMWFDAYDSGVGGTLLVNHLQALPTSVRFNTNRANTSGKPARVAILFNVDGTFSERLMFGGDDANVATTNWPTLGTTDSLVGTVTLTNAAAIYFRTAGQPLSLTVGNVGGTLELRSSLSDWVSGATRIYAGPVVKNGPGTAILAGDGNDWGGTTTVSNGTLLVNSAAGWGAGTNGVFVVDGGALGGTGVVRTVMTTIQAGGTLAPGLGGDAIGLLTLTNLTLEANANYRCNTDNATSDRVRVMNNATLPSAMTVTITRADSTILSGTRTILEVVDGTLSGDPSDWTVVAPSGGYTTELAPGGKAVLLKGPLRGTVIGVL
jgi:autotransporter-associated beta strand protein